MECAINKRRFMFWHYLSWYFVYWSTATFHSQANYADGAPGKWHVGCFTFSDKLNSEIRRFQAEFTTPVNCARICLQEGYNFTGLSAEDLCQCLQNESLLAANISDDCLYECAIGDLRLPCGGPNAYSVYASEGPYIKTVRIDIPSTTVYVGQPFRLRVLVTLASSPNVLTGLTVFENVSFDTAEITVTLGTVSRVRNVRIVGRVGVLEIQHTFDKGGDMQKLGASAKNPLSSDRHLLLASVMSLRPQGLKVQLASFYTNRPSCTPKALLDQIPPDEDHVTVIRGERVKLSAVIRQGVNVTFDWNFCFLERRRSTPHLESDGSCVPAPLKCTIDEQVFQFNHSGACKVSVNASNHLGANFSTIHVIALEPAIGDVTVRPAQCEQAKCNSNPWNPAMLFPENPSHPSSSTGDSLLSTTSDPLSLDPGFYRTGEKVCFHATALLVVRDDAQARIRFGDHESMSIALSAPDWDLDVMLGRRKRSSAHAQASAAAGATSWTTSQTGLSLNRYGVNFTHCHSQHCTMDIYFSHVYKKSGYYSVDVQILNSRDKMSGRIEKAIRVIGDAKSTDTLICESLVRTGDLTSMAVRGAKGVNFEWTVDRREDSDNPIDPNELVFSAHWQRLYRKNRPSPMHYTFDRPGVYFVRIIESHRYIEQEFCLIFVEEEINDVTVTVQPDVRYVTVGEAIRISVKVELGSNFTVTWSVGNFTNKTEGRHDAPYSSSITYVPDGVVCQQVHVIIQNSISRAEPALENRICSEETLSGLTLEAPSELEAGESAEIVVRVQSGSNVEISVELTCFLGSRFQFFTNSTGPTTGPSVFKFRTRPFKRPGIFPVVVRARNHVPTDKRHLVERGTIVVGRRINTLSALRVSRLNSSVLLNEQNNTVVALVNGFPDNSTGILYTWSYPGPYGLLTSHESASPVVKIIPGCSTSIGNCYVNLTATSGISSDRHVIPIVDDGSKAEHLVEHPVTVALGESCDVTVNCTPLEAAELDCRVEFADDNDTSHSFSNTTNNFTHVYTTPGLWTIAREVTYQNSSTSVLRSYISVQEEVGQATLQGDTLVYLDASPIGQWRAKAKQGTHLIYQWAVKRKNAPVHLTKTSKVSCEREFAYHFTQTGTYDVILTIRNDVSSVNVSAAVEVRHSVTHFVVQVAPVYFGQASVFYLSANISKQFTLTVRWDETGLAQSFTQDQLFVVNEPTNSTWSQYELTHIYGTSGPHQYHFTFDWLAGSNIATRDIVNYTTVHDVATNPPYQFVIRRDRGGREVLQKPYHVEVGEAIAVDLSVNALTSYLNCLVFYEHKLQHNFSRSFSGRGDQKYKIRFNASESGSYKLRISAKPGNLITTVHIVAYYRISKLTLNKPALIEDTPAGRTARLVEKCELKKQDPLEVSPYACSPVLLQAQSNGHNVTFRFLIRNTYDGSIDEVVVKPNVTNGANPVMMGNLASLEYTFRREGAYNISVTAFAVDGHDPVHEVASTSRRLPFLFYAASMPSVYFPHKLYVVERAKPFRVELMRNIPGQRLTVNWKIEKTNKVYRNAGFVMDQHSYRYKGRFSVQVRAFNRLGSALLKFWVMVQERLLSVDLPLRQTTFSTNEWVRFAADVLPPNAGSKYKWQFTKVDDGTKLRKLVYKPTTSYMFQDSGRYRAQVTVVNSLNNVTSSTHEFTLLDLIEPFYITAPEAVAAGMSFSVASASYNRHSKPPVANRSWNFGDGSEDVLNQTSARHAYKEPGIYEVTHRVWNELKNLNETWKIFVTKAHCPLPKAALSAVPSPISRSQRLYVEASIDFDCPQVTALEYRWAVRKRLSTHSYSPALHNSTGQILHLPPRSLDYGVFEISLNATLVGTVLFATEELLVRVEPAAPVAVIDGGTARSVSRRHDLVIDASQSFDPDYPERRLFSFAWSCHVLHSPGLTCFRDPLEGVTERAFQPVAQPMRQRVAEFPSSVASDRSVLAVPGRYFTTESDTFIFVVNVTQEGRPSSSATFVAKIVEEEVATVQIRCPSCHQSSINPQRETLLFAECQNCRGGHVEYSWTISLVDDGADVIRDESSDCVPPSGKGWMSWSSNSTSSNESLSQSDIDEAFRNYTTDQSGTPEHHDENFTGILPPHDYYDERELEQPANVQDSGPSTAVTASWEDLGEEYLDALEDQGSYEDPDVAYPQYGGGLSQLYNLYPSPRELEPADNPAAEIHEDTAQTGAAAREQGMTSGGRIMMTDGLIGFRNYRPSSRASSYGGPSSQLGLNPDALRNRGRHGSAMSSGGSSQADKLRSDSALNHLPAHMHYQSYGSEELSLDEMARLPEVSEPWGREKAKVIILRKNKFLEGRTYSITADAKHYSDDGRLVTEGSSTYYLHVIRGPSMGSCSVVAKKDGRNTFHVHCMGWKNVGRKASDVVAMDESINYEIKYSLGEDGPMRTLYYGPYYEKSFTLPESDKEVYVHVILYNSAGVSTKVCSFPANITNDHTRFQTAVDLSKLFDLAVGDSSQLSHIVLREDGNAILGFVNVILDSMPPTPEIRSLVAESQKYSRMVQNVTGSMVSALTTFRCLRMSASCDLLDTLSRIFAYRDFMSDAALVRAATLLSGALVRSRALATERGSPAQEDGEMWNEIGNEISDSGVVNGIMVNAMSALGHMTSFDDTLRRRNVSKPTRHRRDASKGSDINRQIDMVERQLRDFYLDRVKFKTEMFGPSQIQSSKICMLVQVASQSMILYHTESTNATVSFPKTTVNRSASETLLQAAIMYVNAMPYRSEEQAFEMDSSALSMWVFDNKSQEISVENLVDPIVIKLPTRNKTAQDNKTIAYPDKVMQNKLSQHDFDIEEVRNTTWHISFALDENASRPFAIVVALTDHPLSAEAPLNDTQIVTMACLPKRLSRFPHKAGSNHSVKFTLDPGTLLAPGRFYITAFNPDMPKTKLRRRATIPEVPYNLRVWGSDCFYWKREANEWDRAGCKVVNSSTYEQTVCSTVHLSTYSSSFKDIETILVLRDFVLMTQATALSPCLTVLIAVLCLFLAFLAVHRFVLRRRDSSSDFNELTGEMKSPGVGSWLKWMFGADDRGASGRVPIVLKDNRPDHKQIFEVTVHTANWPGSGTSSMVYMLMYGLKGKYETRELCAPSDDDFEIPGTHRPTNTCYFETGSIKTFIVTFKKNQGALWKICFWHDHSGPRPRWNLDYVIVRDVTTGERWFFPCDSWLALDRGSNRVSRELKPMECKPTVMRHLAIRAKNMILDYHSMISILACARWGILTRAQRIVHILSLCMVIFALASVKTILKESDIYAYDASCFSGENLLWGFIIGAAASLVLLPGQLIFRYTKQDERISVMMEDSTSNSTASPTTNMSRVSLPNKSSHDIYAGHGGLHKTATVTHNFAELDEILSEEQEMPSKFVTDWLQRKEWASASRESLNKESHDPCTTYLPGSITSLDTSVSSYDEEIARCMAHDTSASTCPTHTRNTEFDYAENGAKKEYSNAVCSKDTLKAQSFFSIDKSVPSIYVDDNPRNDQIQNAEADDSADKPSLFAMDGPELVPCERLDPIHHTKTALLPRQCGFVAWVYYVAISFISALCTVYGAEKYLVDTDFDRWIEASCFALFWTAVVIETLFVFFSTLVATLRNLLSRRSDQRTLEELFPTVDSAPVDDYAYKYYSEYGVVSDADSDTITDSEVKMRLSERRRSRYLRNISPPYDAKGKWKSKTNPLRAKAKQLRRSEAAKRALVAWCGLLFLSVILVTITVSLDVGSQGRNGHKKHVTDMFRKTFCLPEGYLLSSNCSLNASMPDFPHISTREHWRRWFHRSFIDRVENATATYETSMLLGSVKVALYRRRVATKCDQLTERMKKILNLPECPEGGALNSSQVYKQVSSETTYELRETSHVDLLGGTGSPNFTLDGDAVGVSVLVYNTMTKHYTSVEAFTEFPWGIHIARNRLQVNSVNLEIAEANTRNALTFCHAVLVVWVAWSAVRQFIIGIRKRAVSEEQRGELSKRSLLPTHAFMKLLSFGVWLVVVFYLISSTVFRANLLRSADYFTVTGHAGSDYDEFLQAVFTSEVISRQLLAAWTVLLVLQCVNYVVSWHGSSSKFTRALTAMCGSVTSGSVSIYLVFAVFLFLLSAVGYLFFGSTLFYHATASKALQQTTSWSAGVATVASEGKSKLVEAKKRSGIVLAIFYFGLVFLIMRVFLKGLIVAAYQRKLWRLKRSKSQREEHKPASACKKKKKPSPVSAGSRESVRAKSGISQYVLFGDMLKTARQEVSSGAKLALSTIFCGKLPAALWTQDEDYSSYSRPSTSRESLRTISDKVSGGWDKQKAGSLGAGISSHGTTSGFVEGSTWDATTPDLSVSGSRAYVLSGEMAMSEAELQVHELCVRATELIDDAMSNLDDYEIPGVQELTKTISQISQKSGEESDISKLSRELAEFVRRHGNCDDDDDAETVLSSSTLSHDVSSPWAFPDDNETETNGASKTESHSTSKASLRFGTEALLYSQEQISAEKRAPTLREERTPVPASPKRSCETAASSDDADAKPQTLTAFNLARHDRRLTLLRQKLAMRAAAVKQTPVEVLSSVSSKSSASEEQSCESNGGRMNLWQALMKAKHRAKKTAVTPVKARPLRRSQTIFVNAKKLPVVDFLTPPEASETKQEAKNYDRAPHFATAFGSTPQRRSADSESTNGSAHETSQEKRQPDFCEEERTIPGLVPEEKEPSSTRATVITKRTAPARNSSVPAKFHPYSSNC